MGKSKGDRRERECRNLLKMLGYNVESPNYTRYGNTDFWNLFDVMAGNGDRLVFVQVKSNSTGGALKKIGNNVGFLPESIEKEIWVCYDRDGWRVLRLVDGEWVEVVDGRDYIGNMGDGVLKDYRDSY